jgi:hypothetical protein
MTIHITTFHISTLASPRLEKCLLHFSGLSDVGGVMENGKDEEETRAERMDGWIIWEHRDREPD